MSVYLHPDGTLHKSQWEEPRPAWMLEGLAHGDWLLLVCGENNQYAVATAQHYNIVPAARALLLTHRLGARNVLVWDNHSRHFVVAPLP